MPSKLLDQVAEAIRLRHLTRRTEQAYVQWVKRFVLFHDKRHPVEMGENEIRSFLSHLARDEYVSSSTQNQALNALVFRESPSAARSMRTDLTCDTSPPQNTKGFFRFSQKKPLSNLTEERLQQQLRDY